jgi:hypothetical protein
MTTKENEAKDRRIVIVAGAQGVSESAVLKQYAALPGTTVYGLSRRPSESSGNIQHISVDLLSPGDVKAKLGQLKEITHFVFGAYAEKPTATEKTEVNGFDNVSSTIKVRQAGFHDCLDSETMFSQFFGKLREMKLLPAGMREGS